MLNANLEMAREWARSLNGFVEWREPQAGAIALMKYRSDIPSVDLCERIRTRRSTLIVPGKFLGIEGFVRIWLGGRQDYMQEGLRRIAEEFRSLANPA